MTKKQQIIILKWVVVLLLFASMIVFEEWIGNHSNMVRISFLITFLIFSFTGDPFKSKKPIDIQKIVDGNSWIKLYLLLFGLVIIVNAMSGTLAKIASEYSIFGALLLPLFFLSLPFIIVTQRKKFIKAGKV